MRKNILLACALFVFTVLYSCHSGVNNEPQVYNTGINIIPNPARLTEKEGKFELKRNTILYVSGPEEEKIGVFFIPKINEATGYSLKIKSMSDKNGIHLIIDTLSDIHREGYTLDVTPENMVIRASTAHGLFYGMQTLMQLLPAEIESPGLQKNRRWEIPAISIEDEPRFEYRASMLDACRHFIPVETLKKQLDVLALFKINHLHWHLTDDQGWRMEIKKYPKLTGIGATRIEGEGFEYGGYYTQEEIRDIVRYAGERFITVVPEVELPGHGLAAIAAYPELSCTGDTVSPRIIWGVEDIVFCGGKESTFEFLEDVIHEMADLFPGEYIHLGGDECPKTFWRRCPHCQKRIQEEGLVADGAHSAEDRLQSYFVQRMEKVVSKYGKKMIGWDEILEGGLAANATVMSWRGERGGIAAATMGHDVIMAPNSGGMYIDHFQGDSKIEPVAFGGYSTLEKVYSYDPMPDTLVRIGKQNHVKGVQCNLWAEYLYKPELVEYRLYPRIIALAETGWSQPERKDYEDFCRRLNNALVRLDGHSIGYHIPQPEQPGGSCNFVAFTDKAVMEFTTTRPIKMVYTTDGSDPTPQSEEYTRPLEIEETTLLKIRSVLPSGKMSPVRAVTVEKQAPAPAVATGKANPGLKMRVAKGMYLNTDELEKGATEWEESLIPDLSRITQVVKVDESMRGVEQYAAIATGYIDIPEESVYFFSSELEEVWIDGQRIINNGGEVKKHSRKDSSMALGKGLHEIRVVFLGHIIGGWPSNWNDGSVRLRKPDEHKFTPVTSDMLYH